MKTLSFFILLISIFAHQATAETAAPITRPLDSFRKVKVTGNMQVYLIKSTENRLTMELSGFDEDDLKVKQSSGWLEVSPKPFKSTKSANIKLYIYYKELSELHVSSGANAKSKDDSILRANTLTLECNGGATISLTVAVKQLYTNISTGGSVVLRGLAEKQEVNITAGGTLDAKEMKSYEAMVNVRAGGTAVITAYDKLFTNVAGGTIRYAGNPSEYQEEVTLGGSIIKIDD